VRFSWGPKGTHHHDFLAKPFRIASAGAQRDWPVFLVAGAAPSAGAAPQRRATNQKVLRKR
jgi:hypothetical protein